MHCKLVKNAVNSDLKIIKFKHMSLCSDICHGIFSRSGGCSKKPFDSLNVGLSTGDDEQNVLKNRQIITKTFGKGYPVFISQVHGNKILVLKKDKNNFIQPERGASEISDRETMPYIPVRGKMPLKDGFPHDSCFSTSLGLPPSADGIVTDIPGLLLFIQVADCQPVMLYDPVNKVVANIHSGWKGSLKNIVGAGVDAMKRKFGSDPASVLAGIGPSLGPCCSEFINYRSEIPDQFWDYRRGENHFDFWQMTIDQLTAKGVKKENIELSGICTRCSHDSFFSYRHEKITGRFASVIGRL